MGKELSAPVRGLAADRKSDEEDAGTPSFRSMRA